MSMERKTLQEDCRGMSDSDVRQWAGRSNRAGGPTFDLWAWKLRRPLARPEMVPRPRLIERLAGGAWPIVSVAAPPG